MFPRGVDPSGLKVILDAFRDLDPNLAKLGNGDLALAAALLASPIPLFEKRTYPFGAILFQDAWPSEMARDGDVREWRREPIFGPRNPLSPEERDRRIQFLAAAAAFIALEINRLNGIDFATVTETEPAEDSLSAEEQQIVDLMRQQKSWPGGRCRGCGGLVECAPAPEGLCEDIVWHCVNPDCEQKDTASGDQETPDWVIPLLPPAKRPRAEQALNIYSEELVLDHLAMLGLVPAGRCDQCGAIVKCLVLEPTDPGLGKASLMIWECMNPQCGRQPETVLEHDPAPDWVNPIKHKGGMHDPEKR